MGEFEFISVLVSLIIGLGITNLLSGAGRAFYRRQKSPIDEVHMVLTAATLLILVLNWWVTFSWRTETNWTFEKFLVLIVWMVSLFMLTIFLYPPDLSESEAHRDIWIQNRPGCYGAFFVMCLLDILQTAMRGGLLHQFGISRTLAITRCSVPSAWPCVGEVTTDSLLGTSSSPSWPGHFSSGVFFSKRA